MLKQERIYRSSQKNQSEFLTDFDDVDILPTSLKMKI